MTVEKLRNIEKTVKTILEEQPETRGDDFLLYWAVIKRFNSDLLSLPIGGVLLHHIELGVPNIKSVERARRKAQRKHPELLSEEKKKKRAEEEQAYIEYAVGG